MRSYLFVCICLLAPHVGATQNVEWAFQMGGNGSGNLANIEPKFHISPIDSSIYVTGAFYGTSELKFGDTIIAHDPLLGGENGVFIAKIGRQGGLDWVKAFKGGGANFFHDLAFDNQGSIYVGGQTGDPISIEGTFIDYGGGSGYVLLKYDSQGVFQWLNHGQNGNIQELEWTSAGLVGAMVFESNVVVDGSSFVVTPSSQSPAQDILISVINSNGQLIFSEQVRGDGNVDARALVCNDTMCILQGKFDNTITVEGVDYTTSGNSIYKVYQHAFKIPQFQTKWVNVSSEPFSILMDGLNVGTDGQLYSKAIYKDVFEMQGFSTQSQGDRDILVLRQDLNSGSIIEGRSFGALGSDAVYHILENSGRVIISGTFSSDQVGFNGVSVDNPNQVGMPFIVIMDTTFKGQCLLDMGTDNQSRVFQSELIGDTLYSLLSITTSTYIEDVSFSAFGGFDLALVKTLLPCSRVTDISQNPYRPSTTLELHPNPASQTVRVGVQGSKFKVQSITFIDMLGHTVLHQKTTANENSIDISGLASGLYTVAAIFGNGETGRQRLVVWQ